MPAIPEAESSKNSTHSNPEPMTPCYPCVVCGSTDRWEERGIWRCRQCWPPGDPTPVADWEGEDMTTTSNTHKGEVR